MSQNAEYVRCRIGRHHWLKNMRVDSTPFSISPLAGERRCLRCGKRQRYSYDSQGGCWITVPALTGGDASCDHRYIIRAGAKMVCEFCGEQYDGGADG